MKTRIIAVILIAVVILFVTSGCTMKPKTVTIKGREYFTNTTKLSIVTELTDSDIKPLKYMTELKELNLNNTGISNINPLKSLTNLTHLYLDDNNISDITALSGLTNLKHLTLNGNNINDISALKDMTSLTRLWLYNNQISDEQIAELQTALPDCEIIYILKIRC